MAVKKKSNKPSVSKTKKSKSEPEFIFSETTETEIKTSAEETPRVFFQTVVVDDSGQEVSPPVETENNQSAQTSPQSEAPIEITLETTTQEQVTPDTSAKVLPEEKVVPSVEIETTTVTVAPAPQPVEIKLVDPIIEKKTVSNRIVALVIFFVFGLGLFGGIFAFLKMRSSNGSVDVKIVEVSPSPQESVASPSPSPAFNVSTLKVQILNGSGVSGQAGVIKELLSNGGFSSFSTGNAKNFDYQETEVSLKPDASEEIFTLIQGLLPDYETTQSGALDQDGAYDVRVIIGKSKK